MLPCFTNLILMMYKKQSIPLSQDNVFGPRHQSACHSRCKKLGTAISLRHATAGWSSEYRSKRNRAGREGGRGLARQVPLGPVRRYLAIQTSLVMLRIMLVWRRQSVQIGAPESGQAGRDGSGTAQLAHRSRCQFRSEACEDSHRSTALPIGTAAIIGRLSLLRCNFQTKSKSINQTSLAKSSAPLSLLSIVSYRVLD